MDTYTQTHAQNKTEKEKMRYLTLSEKTLLSSFHVPKDVRIPNILNRIFSKLITSLWNYPFLKWRWCQTEIWCLAVETRRSRVALQLTRLWSIVVKWHLDTMSGGILAASFNPPITGYFPMDSWNNTEDASFLIYSHSVAATATEIVFWTCVISISLRVPQQWT
jgi:hypothetical protein